MYFDRQPNRRNWGDELQRIFLSPRADSRLLLINTVVFFAIQVTSVILWLFNNEAGSSTGLLHHYVSWWIGVRSWPAELLKAPWGIVTYMFTQAGFWHFAMNMIILYFGARLFIPMFGHRKLMNVYLLGGLMGAVFFILAMNVFPRFEGDRELASMIGASASVLAILIAAASHRPDAEVHLLIVGKVKLWVIAVMFVLIDIVSIPGDNPGGHFAHLGGALFGFLYGGQGWLRNLKMPGPANWIPKKKRPGPRFYDPVKERPLTDEEFNARKKKRQEQVDRILDKLKEKGYDGLTKEEKEILHNASK